MTDIKHISDNKGGTFIYEKEGTKLAEMVYVMAGASKMIIEHTDVDESLKGKGIGKELLAALVNFSREKQIKVIPLCPFANATLNKTKEWHDVLA